VGDIDRQVHIQEGRQRETKTIDTQSGRQLLSEDKRNTGFDAKTLLLYFTAKKKIATTDP